MREVVTSRILVDAKIVKESTPFSTHTIHIACGEHKGRWDGFGADHSDRSLFNNGES